MAGILLLAVIGALVLDLQQMMSPTLAASPCEEPTSQWMASSSNDSCVWQGPLNEQDQASSGGKPSVTVRITVKEHKRVPQATVSITVPADGPVADAIRRGEAIRDPSVFVWEVAGRIDLGKAYLVWSPPTMSPGDDDHVLLTTTGAPSSFDRSLLRTAESVTVEVRPARYPTDLTVTATQRVVVASQLPEAGTKVDRGKLSARLPADGRLWTVTLGSAQPPSDVVPEAEPAEPAWWHRGELVVWPVVEGWGEFTAMLLGPLPWILLLLAGHTNTFGPVMGRRPEWRRFLRLTGLVLAVHLCVAVALTARFDYAVPTVIRPDGVFFQHVDGWVAWLLNGNVGVEGTAVLLVAAALTLLPAAVRRTTRIVPAARQGWTGYAWACLAVSLLVGTAVLVERADDFDSHPAAETAVGAFALYGGELGVLAVLASCARPLLRSVRGTDSPPVPPLRSFAVMSVVVAGLAAFYDYFGYIPLAARWVLLLLTGATALLCLVALCFRIVTGRYLGVRSLSWLVVGAIALSVPWDRGGNTYIGWHMFVTFAQGVDGLLALLLVTAGVVTLRRIGLGPVLSTVRLRGHRAIGIAISVIVLSSSYSFYRTPSAWALVASVFGAFFLLPSGQVTIATAVLGQDAAAHRRSLGSTVMAGAARRQLAVARRSSREKTAAEGGSLAAQQQAIRRLELIAWRDRDTTPGGTSPTTRERALGALTSRSPWHRGVWGARWGLLVGLPWIALDLVGTASLPQNDSFPLLSAAGVLLPPTLRWTGIGFLFGYFFPLLGGQSGLTKAMRLATAALAPTLLDAVLVPHPSPAWPGSVLAVIQLLAFSLSLGLLADRESLALGRYPWARLADVHNLGSLTAWASSVAAALATAVATLVLAGAQPFVTNLVHPPTTTPQTPPASTASP
ncbi:hypothetical protein ABZ379_33205 [Streptomyces canus]|uniref:hypothetical protein n=1 Tax=Streptomyces canus TaxID=58343 RepID=UPI0033D9FDFE